jgi:hypothetical protein
MKNKPDYEKKKKRKLKDNLLKIKKKNKGKH